MPEQLVKVVDENEKSYRNDKTNNLPTELDTELDQDTPPIDGEGLERYIQYKIRDKDGFPSLIREEEFFGKKWDDSDSSAAISLVRAILPDRNALSEINIHLSSKFLRNLFQEAGANSSLQGVEVTLNSVIFKPPYLPLFHHLESLKIVTENDPSLSDSEREEFKALERVCEKPVIRGGWDSVRRDIELGNIAYSDVWALFKPNEEVLVKTEIKHTTVYSVMRICSARLTSPDDYFGSYEHRDTTGKIWALVLFQNSWNGFEFCDDSQTRTLQRFDGKTKIMNLSIIPLRLHPNGKELRKAAEVRGEKWRQFCEGEMRTMMYDGLATPLIAKRRPSFYWQPAMKPEQVMIRSRVVTDPKAMLKVAKIVNLDHDSEIVTDDKRDDMEDFSSMVARLRLGLRGKQARHPESMDLALCPVNLPVFSLAEHIWFSVNIDLLTEVVWKPEIYKQLEMSNERKMLLAQLTRAHSTEESKRSSDLVSEKGKGLIMLFYGPPGVGKTLTAESLSELTKKPLYKVNLGVLSHSHNWDAQLDLIFECAHDWKAILLIDEADVVLEERTVHGQNQNRWSSVFLRKVEYYQGILILSTNVVNVLDEAFRSRINVGMHFEDLDQAARIKLWTEFISGINSELADRKKLLGHVPEWSREDLNGRQIRNIVLSAETLAIWKGKNGKVEPEDIHSVMKYTMQASLKDLAANSKPSNNILPW